MTIIKFQTEEEVIKMANSTEYALGSSIFTSDYVQAERVAKVRRSSSMSGWVTHGGYYNSKSWRECAP